MLGRKDPQGRFFFRWPGIGKDLPFGKLSLQEQVFAKNERERMIFVATVSSAQYSGGNLFS